MSYTVTKFVLDLPNLTSSEKAVANVLAYHAHPDGTNAFPSMSTIAAKAGLKHRQSAQRVMKRLEEKNIITADTHTRGGTGRTTRYHFVIENSNPEMQLDDSNCSPESANCNPESADLHPASCTKGKERSLKSRNTGARAPNERDHCYHVPGCDCVSRTEEFEAIVNQQLDEEEEIIRSLPPALTNWAARLRPLPLPSHLSEDDAAAAFAGVNDLLFISGPAIEGEDLHGAARLFGTARGSHWSLLDYQRIWALDQKFGAGTSVAVAQKILELMKRDEWHPISIDSFIWNHIADQLIDA
jgi:hypothetical protein